MTVEATTTNTGPNARRFRSHVAPVKHFFLNRHDEQSYHGTQKAEHVGRTVQRDVPDDAKSVPMAEQTDESRRQPKDQYRSHGRKEGIAIEKRESEGADRSPVEEVKQQQCGCQDAQIGDRADDQHFGRTARLHFFDVSSKPAHGRRCQEGNQYVGQNGQTNPEKRQDEIHAVTPPPLGLGLEESAV